MYKFLNPVLIVVYVVFNFCLCIKLIADPSRVIEVKKVLGADDKEPYLKNYHIINNPQAEFDIEVQPKTFWDYILLFNTKGKSVKPVISNYWGRVHCLVFPENH
jgi:hypothetical protein